MASTRPITANKTTTIVAGIIITVLLGIINPFIFLMYPAFVSELMYIDGLVIMAVLAFITGRVIEAKQIE